MHARTCLRLGEISSGLVAFLMLTASSWSVLVWRTRVSRRRQTCRQLHIFKGGRVTNFVCSVVRMEAMVGGTKLNELGGGAWIGRHTEVDSQGEHSKQRRNSDRDRQDEGIKSLLVAELPLILNIDPPRLQHTEWQSCRSSDW